MNIIRTIHATLATAFWWLVCVTGGPRHQSYIHARWQLWRAKEAVKCFLDRPAL